MQPNKPLSEYTVAGLLFIGAQTRDDAVKSAILNELRNRRRLADARREAQDHNRTKQEKLNIELKIEGLQSKDDIVRRRANRDLFAEMKDRAFQIVDIPEGVHPAEAVKQYNKDVHTKAKELYSEFKQINVKMKTIQERREKVEQERKAYRKAQTAEQRSKQIEAAAYQNARLPLIGAAVYYTDTTHGEKKVGTIRGFSYIRETCLFRVRVEKADGSIIKRAFSTIEPVQNADWFNEVKASYTEFEKMERIVRKREKLMLCVEVFRGKIAKLDPVVNEYLQSDFRQNWFAADEVAKAFARDARNAGEDTLF